MKPIRFRPIAGAILVAVALVAPAAAQSPAPRAEAQARASEHAAARAAYEANHEQNAAAREEMRALSTRMAELARQLARDEALSPRALAPLDRPMIGVVLQEDPKEGVRLAGITPESPAARAGLRSGDRLLEINGKQIRGADGGERLRHARELIGRPDDGQKITLRFEREGRKAVAELTAEHLPAFALRRFEQPLSDELRRELSIHLTEELPFDIGMLAPFAGCDAGEDPQRCIHAAGPLLDALRWRGLRMARVDADLGRYFGTDRGVLVLAVDREQLQPLQGGDVILQADGEAVADPGELMRALRRKEVGESVELRVMRDRKPLTLAIEAPKFSRLPIPMPPMPPVPPTPPAAPHAPHPSAPPHPGAAPTPPAPPTPPEPLRNRAAASPRGVIESVLM